MNWFFPKDIQPTVALAGGQRQGLRGTATPSPAVVGGKPINIPPPINGKKNLEKCQNFDQTQREAKFALRKTDLQQLKSLSEDRKNSEFTDMDPTIAQHWSLLVQFPEGNQKIAQKILFFEAVESAEGDNKGNLQVLCAENVDAEVFKKATYFDTLKISPSELLEKAKQVSSNGTKYDRFYNNCQTWVREFLVLTSPKLSKSLVETIMSSESTRDMDLYLKNVIEHTNLANSSNAPE
ncbi:uncharacterized protein LOC124200414 [Daphnia pulex]|uniref:uncharacterized protein LOC124200414 n=1 Tax=Daphnia pulex TaxID=6669 RepID=UPI001EDDF9AD|nr:uncharacterized protein LOC124200414 [Daphnia pulex]